jgi:hypothetical protein
MTTSNTIQTNAFTDTLFVPIESVFTNDSLSFVYLADGKNTKQIIEPGEENENFVVVRQGLTEGQQIYLTEPENTEGFVLAGMEIYNDIKRKNEEEKEKKAEEELKRQMEQKPMELTSEVQMPGGTGVVVVSK